MANLPKPSEISMKNFSQGKSEYILFYLKSLVSSLENIIQSKNSDEKMTERYVIDIRCVEGVLKIKYSNGEEKQITL